MKVDIEFAIKRIFAKFSYRFRDTAIFYKIYRKYLKFPSFLIFFMSSHEDFFNNPKLLIVPLPTSKIWTKYYKLTQIISNKFTKPMLDNIIRYSKETEKFQQQLSSTSLQKLEKKFNICGSCHLQLIN